MCREPFPFAIQLQHPLQARKDCALLANLSPIVARRNSTGSSQKIYQFEPKGLSLLFIFNAHLNTSQLVLFDNKLSPPYPQSVQSFVVFRPQEQCRNLSFSLLLHSTDGLFYQSCLGHLNRFLLHLTRGLSKIGLSPLSPHFTLIINVVWRYIV